MAFTNVGRSNRDVVDAMRQIADEEREHQKHMAWRETWGLRMAVGGFAVAVGSLVVAVIALVD